MNKMSVGIALLLVVLVLAGIRLSIDRDQAISAIKPSNDNHPSVATAEQERLVSAKKKGSHSRDDAGDKANAEINFEELQERYADLSNNINYPDLQTRLDAMHQRHAGKKYSAREVVDALVKGDAWEELEEIPTTLPLSQEDLHDGREFIRFNQLRIETLMPGDILELPIAQLGTRFFMEIDNTKIHDNGSVSINGELKDFDEEFRVTMTVGENLSLAGIDTPNGHYVLQAHGDIGWIASSQTLFKPDLSQADVILPPEEETSEDHHVH